MAFLCCVGSSPESAGAVVEIHPQSAVEEPEQKLTETAIVKDSEAEAKSEQEAKAQAELEAKAKMEDEAEVKEEEVAVTVPEAESKARAEDEAKPTSTPAELEAPPVVMLEFHQGTVAIKRRPVQITFDFTKSPVEVCKVAGHGAELGVKEGWTVKSMEGQKADADFQVFYGSFVMRLNSLPGDFVMPLLFKKSDASLKTIVVPRSPLGMSLNKELPTTVQGVSGLSVQLGIKTGWTLLRYADIFVDSHQDFGSFFEAFKLEMGKLQKV